MATSDAVNQLIEAGMKAQHAGDLASARTNYSMALEQEPENTEALHLLGVLEAQAGNFEGGAILLERAVSRDPREPLFLINLANARAKLGDFRRAAEVMRGAVMLVPTEHKLRYGLADFEFRAGNYTAALEIYEDLARLFPRNPDILRRFGDTAAHTGDKEKVLAAANRLAEADPDRSDGLRLACGAAMMHRNYAEAANLARTWTERFPNEPGAWRMLAYATHELGRGEQCRRAIERLMELEPNVPANRFIQMMMARFVRDVEDAEQHLEKALKEESETAEAAAAMANLGIHLGQFADAEKFALRAIEMEPDNIRGYLHYVTLKDGKVGDEHLAALEKANAKGGYHPALGGRLSFALGTIYEARGDFERAFNAFREGNERKCAEALAENSVFNAEDERKRTDNFIRFFAGISRRVEFPAGPVVPIFVVGMPRSGTTLAESLLAAHPDVHGAGELMTLNDVHMEVARWATNNPGMAPSDAPEDLLKQWRNQYFEGYPDFGAAKYVVDKQPANHQSVGLIPLLWPEARIIHMRRSPVETCYSIWRRDFPKAWTYANRFEDLGDRYGEYARLTAHWEKVLGPEYLLVQYEDLVADFEAGARRMAEHCGIQWNDAMLDFHRQKRVIRTFSATQVRKPVYRDAVDRSKAYGPLLDPLRDALRKAQVDLETGAWLGVA